MDYEVVVVGAGPAGSSAAYNIAKNGISVLLIDKARFPREKACGDGVTPRAVRMLYRMGLRDKIDGHFLKMQGYRLSAGKSRMEALTPDIQGYPDHSYVIRRFDLDNMVLNHAREAGAEVWEGCKVQTPLVAGGRVAGVRVKREGEQTDVLANVVIGADGAMSPVGKAMGLLDDDPKSMAVALRQYYEGVENTDEYLEMSCEKATRPVLGWVFPVAGTTANVGIGAMLHHVRKEDLNLNKVFDTFVSGTYQASRMLRNARPVSSRLGAVMRWGLGNNRIECPGLMLVGDAASLINPLSGEGISYALESGEMAAEHLLENRGDSGFIYHDPNRNSFRKKLVDRYQKWFKRSARMYKMVITTPFLSPGLAVVSKIPGFPEFNFRRTLNMME